MTLTLLPSERVVHAATADGFPERIQWTHSASDDQHLYFTSPSITADNRYLIVISDRSGTPNLYRIDRQSGELLSLTASQGLLRSYVYPAGGSQGLSKVSPSLDAARRCLYWIQDNAVWKCPLDNPAAAFPLAEWPQLGVTGYTALDVTGQKLCVASTTPSAFAASDRSQHDQLLHVPRRLVQQDGRTELWIVDTASGDRTMYAEVPFWVTHPLFDPTDSSRLIVNSEGFAALKPDTRYPYWGRLWRVDSNGRYERLIQQPWNRTVIHENFSPLGSTLIYHGHVRPSGWRYPLGIARRIINRVQHRCGFAPIECDAHYVQALSPTGAVQWTVETPFRVNHAVAIAPAAFVADSRDGHLWYGVRDVSGTFRFERLAVHGSTYRVQDCHPHPRLSPDRMAVTYNSDEAGSTNVYEIDCALPLQSGQELVDA